LIDWEGVIRFDAFCRVAVQVAERSHRHAEGGTPSRVRR
jgi:hypothetical protein